MNDRIKFYIGRISERLWVRPLAMSLLSVAAVFVAKAADDSGLGEIVPEIAPDSIETLLGIMAASMLVIATFSVASMVAAYASASGTATPRSFALVIADDVSQNALSIFIGAFIFSIVALIVLMNSYFDKGGRFALFALTLMVFASVIVTFVRWVDSIARLGRLGGTIDKVEAATAAAMAHRRRVPTLGGVPVGAPRGGRAIYGSAIGYLQRVDVAALQTHAERSRVRIVVAALPGTFCTPDRALAHVSADSGDLTGVDTVAMAQEFLIGDARKFEEDPRFGLIVLSEIASRALSPAVNDPGTAIDVIGTLVRLFAQWAEPLKQGDTQGSRCDRVEVPELSVRDMFDDAFSAMARDGAGTIEVVVRMQKAFESLASIGTGPMRDSAIAHARLALARAELKLELPEDLDAVRRSATCLDASPLQ